MTEVEGDEVTFKGVGGLFGVNLDGAAEKDDTGDEQTVLDDCVGDGLHDGCYESGDSFLAKGCSHRVREGGGTGSEAAGDGAEEDDV